MSDSYMWKEQIHTLMKGGESESDISDSEHFLTKGAFLLTPSHGLSMEKASAICEKMEFKGCFSLTKTATGILFKFSSVDDYQMVFKKGFHKVTGSRFYRKVCFAIFYAWLLSLCSSLLIDVVVSSMFQFNFYSFYFYIFYIMNGFILFTINRFF